MGLLVAVGFLNLYIHTTGNDQHLHKLHTELSSFVSNSHRDNLDATS